MDVQRRDTMGKKGMMVLEMLCALVFGAASAFAASAPDMGITATFCATVW
jgi:hypothetical protein